MGCFTPPEPKIFASEHHDFARLRRNGDSPKSSRWFLVAKPTVWMDWMISGWGQLDGFAGAKAGIYALEIAPLLQSLISNLDLQVRSWYDIMQNFCTEFSQFPTQFFVRRWKKSFLWKSVFLHVVPLKWHVLQCLIVANHIAIILRYRYFRAEKRRHASWYQCRKWYCNRQSASTHYAMMHVQSVSFFLRGCGYFGPATDFNEGVLDAGRPIFSCTPPKTNMSLQKWWLQDVARLLTHSTFLLTRSSKKQNVIPVSRLRR